MKEYIERERLLEVLERNFGYTPGGLVMKQLVKSQPAVNVIPELHEKNGKWITRGGWFRCSECDKKTLLKESGGTGGFYEYEQVKSNYCPNCGAKME